MTPRDITEAIAGGRRKRKATAAAAVPARRDPKDDPLHRETVRVVEAGQVVKVTAYRAARLVARGAASLPADTTREELTAIEAATAARLANEMGPLERDGLLVGADGGSLLPNLKELWRWVTKWPSR